MDKAAEGEPPTVWAASGAEMGRPWFRLLYGITRGRHPDIGPRPDVEAGVVTLALGTESDRFIVVMKPL